MTCFTFETLKISKLNFLFYSKESDPLDSKEVLAGIEDRIVRFKKEMHKASSALLKRLIRNMLSGR